MNSWSMYCLTRLDFPTVLFPTTAILRSLLHSMLMLYSLSFVISFCIFCFLKLLYLKKGIFVVCRCAIEGRFCSFSKKKCGLLVVETYFVMNERRSCRAKNLTCPCGWGSAARQRRTRPRSNTDPARRHVRHWALTTRSWSLLVMWLPTTAPHRTLHQLASSTRPTCMRNTGPSKL